MEWNQCAKTTNGNWIIFMWNLRILLTDSIFFGRHYSQVLNVFKSSGRTMRLKFSDLKQHNHENFRLKMIFRNYIYFFLRICSLRDFKVTCKILFTHTKWINALISSSLQLNNNQHHKMWMFKCLCALNEREKKEQPKKIWRFLCAFNPLSVGLLVGLCVWFGARKETAPKKKYV